MLEKIEKPEIDTVELRSDEFCSPPCPVLQSIL